ncbi:MAG: hypothetical protein MUC50_09840 [Myxococcota bacterium]|jgi:hypothetical protein|nr:hypothetical protein [Myxococcota bacterium]
MAQQQPKGEASNSSSALSGESSKQEEPRTWTQRNGGNLIGIITFGLLALVTFLMWLSNSN